MRGPYAQFSLDEVELIHTWALAARQRPDSELSAAMINEIAAKCECAIRTDPRFRQPNAGLTQKEYKDALHDMQ